MEALLPLVGLAATSGGLLYFSRQSRRARENFVVDPSVETAFGTPHANYVRDSASKFNPLMNLANPLKNPLLPPGYGLADVTSAQQNIKSALMSANAKPSDPSFNLSQSDTSNILLPKSGVGTAMYSINKCESVKTVDCSKFDNEEFNQSSCGICHEEGVNSGANRVVGGLFVLKEDKVAAELNAQRMGSRRVNYTPSVGTCKPGRFSTTKEQCLKIKKEMECEAKQAFDADGCSQCYQDSTFRYVDPTSAKVDPILILAGSGSVTVKRNGAPTGVNASLITQTKTLSNSAETFQLPSFKESDTLEISLSSDSSYVAGFLKGTTAGGDFRMDIMRLIVIDTVSNSKPRMSSVMDVDGSSYTVLRTARGKTSAKFVLQNVFTFIDPMEAEAAACGASGYITKPESATLLESSPCYKKGQAPGNYSMECLQNTFVNAGCEYAGEGYPSTTAKAAVLMSGNKSIGQIAGDIYQKSISSYTGLGAAGEELPINTWDSISKTCTGISIKSPCDADNKASGPLSQACLDYLWRNQGAVDNIPGGIGPTYTSDFTRASLYPTLKDRFCTADGTMAPVNTQGQRNTTAYNLARTKGGVAAVQQFYNSIHTTANDNTRSDSERKNAIMQCYGKDLDPLVEDTSAAPPPTCVPQVIVAEVSNPTTSTNYGVRDVKANWIWSFTIRQTERQTTGSNWLNIFRMTRTGSGDLQYGSRSPGVFLHRTGYLQVSVVGSNNVTEGFGSTKIIPLNQDVNVVLSYIGGKYTLKQTGGGLDSTETFTIAAPGEGPALLQVPDPVHVAFLKGSIKNLAYCTFGNEYVSLLDSNSGRTKNPRSVINYPAMNWAATTKPAVVLVRNGQGPWGTRWNPLIQDTAKAASWIWDSMAGLTNDASSAVKSFYKVYTNITGQAITATISITLDDNSGQLLVNDSLVGSWNGGNISFSVILPPGENKIQINGRNGGGPGGVVAIAKNASGATLFVTDSSWLTNK